MLEAVAYNWLAILAAAVLNMVLGALWYGPLFAKPWAKAMGKSMEQLRAEMERNKSRVGKSYAVSFVMAILAAAGVAAVVQLSGVPTMLEGAFLGGMVWLAFVATTNLPTVLFEDRPHQLYSIFQGYQAVWFVLTGALVAAWP